MSFLVSLRASSRQATRSNFVLPASRFHTSAARSLHENNRNREDLPHHYESNKQASLTDNKNGKGKWRSELASTSEQNVRADRGEFEGEHPSFEAMQQKTAHSPHETHRGPGNKQ